MTNEEKAEVIAVWDKWIFDPIDNYYRHNNYSRTRIGLLTELYLIDLNWLAPVSARVIIELEDIGKADMAKELTATMILNISLNTYQPLFDAVYDAIVYLKNQNQ